MSGRICVTFCLMWAFRKFGVPSQCIADLRHCYVDSRGKIDWVGSQSPGLRTS